MKDYKSIYNWQQRRKNNNSDFNIVSSRESRRKARSNNNTICSGILIELGLGKKLVDTIENKSGTVSEIFRTIELECYLQCYLQQEEKENHSLDEFFFHYSVQIGHSIEKHKEIMELLEWAKKNHKITGGILDFVNSRRWLDIKELKEKGMEGIEESTFNVYESI